MKKTVSAIATLVVILTMPVLAVWADVSPPQVKATLDPGTSTTIDKTVDVPDVIPKLDLFLIVDLSGSYDDDVEAIQVLAPDLFDDVRFWVPDSKFGLGSFVDFPFCPWGGDASSDYAYRLDQDLTTSRSTWLAAINAMVALYGGDDPESQYEALYQAATGAGRQMPPTTDGDYTDQGEIAPGQDPGWRAGATKVIAITTDNSFHVAGDSGLCDEGALDLAANGQVAASDAPAADFDYPGPSRNQAINALNAAGIKVIAIKAPGSGSEMDDLASATGGSVQSTGSSSAEITDAILAGLADFTYDLRAEPQDCEPLAITFDPASYQDVPGGQSYDFEETIRVPRGVTVGDLGPNCVVRCSVDFYADDTVVGTQTIAVTVPICGAAPPPFVPEASTLILFGSAATGLASYVGLQIRARRRK